MECWLWLYTVKHVSRFSLNICSSTTVVASCSRVSAELLAFFRVIMMELTSIAYTHMGSTPVVVPDRTAE
jgi:hypothetical protein